MIAHSAKVYWETIQEPTPIDTKLKKKQQLVVNKRAKKRLRKEREKNRSMMTPAASVYYRKLSTNQQKGKDTKRKPPSVTPGLWIEKKERRNRKRSKEKGMVIIN